jgi:hypothetical protein
LISRAREELADALWEATRAASGIERGVYGMPTGEHGVI